MGSDARVTISGKHVSRPRSFYRPELDLLRFCAFLLVLVDHSFGTPDGTGFRLHLLRTIQHGSAMGVPLFFLLSAYLITELLYKEKESQGDINLRDFYVRRILRIWPVYFLALASSAMWGLFKPAEHVAASGYVAYLLMCGNWWNTKYTWLNFLAAATWSISVEEQFYFFLPVVAKRVSRTALLLIAGMAWVFSQGYTFWLAGTAHVSFTRLWFDSITQGQFFALGILASLLLRGRVPKLASVTRVGLLATGLLFLFCGEWTFGLIGSNGRALSGPPAVIEFGLAGLGVVCIFMAFLGARPPDFAKAGVYLGKISYGLYVYHLAVLACVLWLMGLLGIHHYRIVGIWTVGLGLTIVVAHLSYHYFEKPFLVLKERFTIVRSREA